jgi:hypothetical protein
MQSLASPSVVCEARIRELESLFASMSSYIEALESRVSSLEPLLPQAQRAELQVVEALAGANDIEARVSLLEQVTARAHFAPFDPHRGSAAACSKVDLLAVTDVSALLPPCPRVLYVILSHCPLWGPRR